MRRDRQKGEWGFGSRRLALLATVLAMLSIAGLCALVWMIRKDVLPQAGGAASTEIPAVLPGSVVSPPSLAPVVPPIVMLDPTPTPRATATPVARSVPTPRASAPGRTVAPAIRAAIAAGGSGSAPARPAVVQPERASSSPVARQPDPDPVRTPVPAPAPSPAAVTVQPTTASSTVDRNRNQGVERRDARREAREAAEALRDIRPR